MEKVELYRQHIRTLLERYGIEGDDGVGVQQIIDPANDPYQLVHVGWQNKRRIYGCVLHIDIQNQKIWIQHDGTEIGMANELVDMGVPKEDIVLAFHAPYRRQFTEFGVG